MNQWYAIKKGRTEGPFDDIELAERIRQRKLGPLDLLYRDGDSEWRPLMEYEEARKLLGEAKPPPVGDQWVVLKRKPAGEGKRGFEQAGPFSKSEIRSQIERGELSFQDYVWRDGMREWYKIAHLSDFNTVQRVKVEFIEPPPVSPVVETPAEELLESVVRVVPGVPAEAAAAPDEEPTRTAAGSFQEGLTVPLFKLPAEALAEMKAGGSDTAVKGVQKGKSPHRKSREEKDRKGSVRRDSWIEDRLLKPVRKWLKRNLAGLALSALALTAAGVLLLSLTRRDIERLQVPKPLAVSAPSKPEVIEKPAVIAPVIKAEEEPKKVLDAPKVVDRTEESQKGVAPAAEPDKVVDPDAAPTYLRIVPKNLEGDRPELILNTDAGSKRFLHLKIRANSGDVLKLPSFYREFRFRGSLVTKVNLRAEGLPPGRYHVEAEVDSFKKEMEMFVGEDDKSFREEVWRHKKGLVLQHQSERNELIRLAQRLADQLGELTDGRVSSIRDARRAWSKVRRSFDSGRVKSVGLRSANRFVYPFLWMELRDLRNEVDQALEGAKSEDSAAEILSQAARKANAYRDRVFDTTIY